MRDSALNSSPSRDAGRPGDRRPVVGVLGGMGPAATADFYSKLIRATPAEKDQDHLRVVIWSDPTTPDRSQALLADGTDPTPWLLHGASVLAQAGADLIVVPCNTAHAFLPGVAERVGVQIVHMIEETARHLGSLEPRVHTAGLLATTGTIQAKLYRQWLDTAGIDLLTPHPASQDDEVMVAIRSLKAGANAPDLLRRAAQKLIDRGAQAIIAGCTEVPLGLRAEELTVPLADPSEVLARVVVERARIGNDHQ